MRSPKKIAAVAAAAAVMAPIGIAQATHESGKAGAPGQMCKPLLQAKTAQVKAFRNATPKPTSEQVRAFRKTQQAAYKACIKGAAEARSADKPAEQPPAE
jgi:hypothetical protein